MHNNSLGLTRNNIKTNELKERYNTLSKVFHPDKVDPMYAEASQKIFIKILEDYQTYQNPLILSLVKIYGDDFGVELYNKYKDQFELIQAHIMAERLDFEQVLWIYKNEIEEISEYIYYNNYSNDMYWLDVTVNHELPLENYKGATSLSLAMSRSLGGCILGLNLSFDGSFEEEYSCDLGTSLSFYTYVLGKKLTNTVRSSLFDFKNVVLATGYSVLGCNFAHELSLGGSMHTSHRVEYAFHDNSLVRLNLISSGEKTQYVLSLVNNFAVTKALTLKSTVMLFKKAAKIKLGAEYQFNDMFKLLAQADVVHAFEHSMSEYYKIENSFIGFSTSVGSAKLKIGANYRYNAFKNIEIRLKYYRLSLSLPVILTESDLVTAGCLFGTAAIGFVFYLYKMNIHSIDQIKKFKNSRVKLDNIESKLKNLTTKELNVNKDEVDASDKALEILDKFITISECYITLKSVSKLTPNELKNRRIPKIDCTSLVTHYYKQSGTVDFDKVIKQINNVCDGKLTDVVESGELSLCVLYTEEKLVLRKILSKGDKTSLNRVFTKSLLHKILNYALN